jgi:uncharacterized membrane protein YgaE (UPF0421/DUF939 family)
MAELIKRAPAEAWERLREALGPISVAALGAAIAWLVAHDVLGHRQPFFAPIAAAIALSTSSIGRTFRIVQMVGGVLLGIALGVGLSKLLGTSAVALGVITLVTLAMAVVIGAGFVGRGMMFANQAAASAILVVTLHRSGTGSERGLDAIVGGAVALVLGVLLFPPEPLRMVAGAERAVLCSLSDTLAQARLSIERGSAPGTRWLIERAEHAHNQLEILAGSAASARRAVRIAPRRWRIRLAVAEEGMRLEQMWPLVDAVIGVVRAVVEGAEDGAQLPPSSQWKLESLGIALSRLADAPPPWSADVLEEVRQAAEQSATPTGAGDRVQIVEALLRTAAGDVSALIGAPRSD